VVRDHAAGEIDIGIAGERHRHVALHARHRSQISLVRGAGRPGHRHRVRAHRLLGALLRPRRTAAERQQGRPDRAGKR
jgi:hypothetical protein